MEQYQQRLDVPMLYNWNWKLTNRPRPVFVGGQAPIKET